MFYSREFDDVKTEPRATEQEKGTGNNIRYIFSIELEKLLEAVQCNYEIWSTKWDQQHSRLLYSMFLVSIGPKCLESGVLVPLFRPLEQATTLRSGTV